MLATGKQYIDRIKTRPAEVFIGGEKVTDVTSHPAFRNAVVSISRLYDVTSSPANRNRLTYVEKETGQHCNPIFLRPKSREDLALRRRVHEAWAEETWGLIGRSPDHVAGFITGMACVPEVLAAERRDYAKNVMNYWRYVRDNDLYLSYAVVPPSSVKSSDPVVIKARSEAKGKWGESAGLRAVKDDDKGVTVWGFKILATGAALADEVLIGNIQPLAPGMEPYAITFALPRDTPGLKFLSRRSFEQTAVSELDDPLAYRYDETDSVVFCDNVHVPWERVFAYNHLGTGRAAFNDTPAHTLGNAQAHIRLLAKLRLALGTIKRVVELNGIGNLPPIRDALARIAIIVAIVEGLIVAQESNPEAWPNGFVSQDRQTMYATMAWTMEQYPGLVQIIRELLASHPFQQPADVSVFDNAETSDIYSKFAMAEPDEAITRYKLMRLAWDLVGSEFASRHTQYEMFYAGGGHVSRGRASHYFRWQAADQAVTDALERLGGFDKLVRDRVRESDHAQ